MGRPETTIRRILLTAVTLLPRALPRMLVLSLVLMVALCAALAGTVLLAASTAAEVARAIADGSSAGVFALFGAGVWVLLPAAFLAFSALVYVGMASHFADAAYSQQRVRSARAFGLTVRRGASVVATVGLVVGATALAIVAAPVISLGALVATLGGERMRSLVVPRFAPDRRALAWAIVPFLVALVVLVRWSLAPTIAYTARVRAREALRSSRTVTTGSLVTVGTALAVAGVGSLLLTQGAMWLGGALGDSWSELIVATIASVLISPFPAFAALAAYRLLGGAPSIALSSTETAAGAVRARRRLVPATVSLALLATLLTPTAPATASELESALATGDVATTVTLTTPVTHTPVEFGSDALIVEGRVAPTDPAETSIPTGSVRMVGLTVGATQAIQLGSVTMLQGGEFAFDRNALVPGVTHYWVEYSGDSAHEPSESAQRQVSVSKLVLRGMSERVSPVGDPVVGGIVTLRYVVDQDGGAVPGTPVTGTVNVRSSSTNTLLGSAQPVDGVAVIQFTMPSRSLQYVVGLDDSPYYYSSPVGGGEQVLTAASPAATSIGLSAQAAVESGGAVFALAEVVRPAGVAVAGFVEFWASVNGTRELVATVPAGADGVAELVFCVQEGADGACDGSPHPIAIASAAGIQLQAEFRPDPDDEPYRSLLPSSSALASVALVPQGSTGSGSCLLTHTEARLDRLGFTTPAEAALLGAPRIVTPANCGNRDLGELQFGHHGGTVLTLQAQPKPGYELVAWRYQQQTIGTTRSLVWQLPDDPNVTMAPIEAVYRPVCVPFDTTVRGYATSPTVIVRGVLEPASVFGACTLPGGARGAHHGSTVEIDIRGANNPVTGENDVLHRVTIDGTAVNPSAWAYGDYATNPEYTVSFVATRATEVVIEYGPVCRTVTAAETDGTTGSPRIVTEPNCSSPSGGGYLRGSDVTVHAESDDPSAVALGWWVNGEPRPDLGSAQEVTVAVDASEQTIIGYDIARCYPLTATVSEARLAKGVSTTGSRVAIEPAANCSDGSERWFAGTQVTVTAHAGGALGAGAVKLSGWSDQVLDTEGSVVTTRIKPLDYDSNSRFARNPADVAIGTFSGTTRTFVLDEPLAVTAHFYAPDACSTITVRGGLTLGELRFPDTGCGPGRYFDQARVNLPADGTYTGPEIAHDGSALNGNVTQPMRQQYYEFDTVTYPYTTLDFSIPGSELALDATATMSQVTPSRSIWTWKDTTDVRCADGSCSVDVRGDVRIRIAECQTIDPVVRLVIAGDETEREYSPEELGIEGVDWIVSDTPGCGAGRGWSPGTRVVLHGQAPAIGFEFLDWRAVDNAIGLELTVGRPVGDPRSPFAVHVRTDDVTAALSAEIVYRMHCGKLNLGDSIAIVSPAPTCPGAEGELGYVIGSYVLVAAQGRNHTGRDFEGFRGTIAGTHGTITASSDEFAARSARSHNNWNLGSTRDYAAAYAIVDSPQKTVWGYYQFPKSGWEKFVGAIPQVGKLAVGVLSVGLGAALSLCPPCAGALALLQMSEFLIRLMPAGDFLGNILAMANPLNFLKCSAGWGFDTLDGSPAGGITDTEGAFASIKVGGGLAADAAKTYYVANAEMSSMLAKTSSAIKYGGAMASFAYGLYENRIWEFELSGANRQELRNTDAYVSCLADTYKDPVPPH